jgi:hypothetical protein
MRMLNNTNSKNKSAGITSGLGKKSLKVEGSAVAAYFAKTTKAKKAMAGKRKVSSEFAFLRLLTLRHCLRLCKFRLRHDFQSSLKLAPRSVF